MQGREESIQNINKHLLNLKSDIERAVPGIKVVHKPNVWKLMCMNNGVTIKIEVNGTKRGIIGEVESLHLCEKARSEFGMSCVARLVPWGQLLGGKITAALSRQHPRDLFDCRFLTAEEFQKVKDGFMLCLLGSDKPIVESLAPNCIDQSEALESQFDGMTDEKFSYDDFESSRSNLIRIVNEGLSDTDKEFLLSFENGEPDWGKCCAGDLSTYPSVQWKLQNIAKLKSQNPIKFETGVTKLKEHLDI